MTEDELVAELDKEPFIPFRIHLVSGKTLDVLGANAAFPMTNSLLLVLLNPSPDRRHVEGYNVIAYSNIERLEQLTLGKRPSNKRRSA